jgi:hypothetical protein
VKTTHSKRGCGCGPPRLSALPRHAPPLQIYNDDTKQRHKYGVSEVWDTARKARSCCLHCRATLHPCRVTTQEQRKGSDDES